MDLAPLGLLGERLVGQVEQPFEVDLLLDEGEAVRVELRQVEEVADEAGQPVGLGLDDLERGVARVGIRGEPLPQRVDVAADRRQRRPQLMRHGHQEVPLPLVRLREPPGHLAEALREVTDLVAGADRLDLDVVAPARDPVCGTRQREQRLRDAPREVQKEQSGDEQAAEEGEPDPPDQDRPALPQLRARLGDDEGPERLPEQLDRLRDREVRAVLARRNELDRGASARAGARAPPPAA